MKQFDMVSKILDWLRKEKQKQEEKTENYE